jgi:nucleotide-binding universal stress UspA family protein
MCTDGAVVVGLDASESSRQAARWAAREADSLRRPLLLVHVFARPLLELTRVRLPDNPESSEPLQQAIRRELQAVVEQCLRIAPELEIRTEILSGDPVEVLTGSPEHTELLVVGSSGVGSGDVVAVGSTSAELLSHPTGAPVVITRGREQDRRGEVVVGADGSANSERAIEFAFDFASRHQCRLVVVHASSDQPSRVPERSIDRNQERQKSERVLSVASAGYAERYPDVAIRRVATLQRPADALIDESRRAGLLVVGSHGRGPVRRAFLGSVSHAVVRSAPCPVAILRV